MDRVSELHVFHNEHHHDLTDCFRWSRHRDIGTENAWEPRAGFMVSFGYVDAILVVTKDEDVRQAIQGCKAQLVSDLGQFGQVIGCDLCDEDRTVVDEAMSHVLFRLQQETVYG